MCDEDQRLFTAGKLKCDEIHNWVTVKVKVNAVENHMEKYTSLLLHRKCCIKHFPWCDDFERDWLHWNNKVHIINQMD